MLEVAMEQGFALQTGQGKVGVKAEIRASCRIRDAAITDMATVAAIYAPFVETSTATFELQPPTVFEMQKRLQATLDRTLPFLVAELNGYIVGYCYASQYRPRAGYRFTVEDSIYVRADCTGYGVGKMLLSELISRCRIAECHSMVACICGPNLPSVALHTQLGFRHAGVLPEAGLKFGRWLDLSIMQRALSAEAFRMLCDGHTEVEAPRGKAPGQG